MAVDSFLFMSPGVGTDAGGWVLKVVNGKVVVVPVPGWNPQVLEEVTTAVNILAASANIKDQTIKRQMKDVAEGIVNTRGKEIQAYMKQLSTSVPHTA
jgi:hypothetical protein